MQPLPAAATRRRSDADCSDVTGAHALARGFRDRNALRADPQRIGGVLDVHAVEDPPVLQEERRADEIVGVGRVRILPAAQAEILPQFYFTKLEYGTEVTA